MAAYNAKNDWRYETLYPPCFYCKHLRKMGTQQSLDGWTCRAFPDGIPGVVLKRIIKHDQRISMQAGESVFESKEYDYGDGFKFISFEGKWHK